MLGALLLALNNRLSGWGFVSFLASNVCWIGFGVMTDALGLIFNFEGFVRDVENVRYCHTPIGGQQINRCKYALRNMEIRLLTIHNCI